MGFFRCQLPFQALVLMSINKKVSFFFFIFFLFVLFCSTLASQNIVEFDSVFTLSATTVISENKKANFLTQNFNFEVKPGDINI